MSGKATLEYLKLIVCKHNSYKCATTFDGVKVVISYLCGTGIGIVFVFSFIPAHTHSILAYFGSPWEKKEEKFNIQMEVKLMPFYLLALSTKLLPFSRYHGCKRMNVYRVIHAKIKAQSFWQQRHTTFLYTLNFTWRKKKENYSEWLDTN